MKDNIGGVILFDETIRQNAKDGTSLVDIISDQGALPGIKVDKGLQPFGDLDETVTIGLDGLDERLKEYVSMGAKFTKWRAVIKIGDDMPTHECIDANMKALADYAKIVQDNGMVPMVEPEVLMDGSHSIEDCYDASDRSLKSLFKHLADNEVKFRHGRVLGRAARELVAGQAHPRHPAPAVHALAQRLCVGATERRWPADAGDS